MSTTTTTDQQPTTSYKGNCHCAQVRYTLTLPSPLYSTNIIQCNCALCTKHGLLMTHCPRKALVFTRGFDESLSAYQTGQKMRTFRFCKGCGTALCFDVHDPRGEGAGEEMVGVNVRTIDGLEVNKLRIVEFDGQSQGEPYTIPP